MAALFTAPDLPGNWSLVAFAAITVLTLVLVGQTPGMRLLGLRLAHPRQGQRLALWRAVVRTALLCLLVPALVVDADGRGLHDRLTDTAVVRDDTGDRPPRSGRPPTPPSGPLPPTAAFGAGDDVVEARLVDELRGGRRLPAAPVPGRRGRRRRDRPRDRDPRLARAAGHPVLGLGPLGVRPGTSGAGVGTVLVHALLAVAEAADERLVAPARLVRTTTGASGSCRPPTSASPPPDPAWGEHFQARHLNGPPSRAPSATRSPSTGSERLSGGGPGAG